MTLAQVFKRPGLYGAEFTTVGEFKIFINTLAVFQNNHFPQEENLALRKYGEFVVRHFNQEFKNICWSLELLYEYRNHDAAIKAGMIFLLEFASSIRKSGEQNVEDILRSAHTIGHVNPNRLHNLIEKTIEYHN